MTSSRRNTTTKTFATVAYWWDRYALAPDRMAEAIFFMASLPSEKPAPACFAATRTGSPQPRPGNRSNISSPNQSTLLLSGTAKLV